MRKIVTAIVLLVAIIACKEEPKVEYAIITGKILNKDFENLTIQNYDRTFEETLDISENGSFIDTVLVEGNSYVLYDGKNPVFMHLEPGFNINVNYDAKDFENSIEITGKGSEVSNYLVLKRKKEKELFGNAKDTYSLNEEEYKEKLNIIKEAQIQLLVNSKGIPNEYLEKEKRNIEYFYLNRLSDYENAYKYFTKKQDFKVSEDFLSELEGLDYTNSIDFEFSNDYKRIVTDNYRNEANNLAKRDSIKRDLAFLKTVSAIENETIKNGLLFDYANFNMGYSEDVDALYKSFMSNSTNDKNNAKITEKYNKLKALNTGKPSPEFVDYENYAGGTTSLEDLKGKYIYIDVWATWCGPCIAEIPSLKKVEEQFHDNNIKFVSISIDKPSDHEKWKTMVKEKELSGIQLFADNEWKSGFVTDYQISGIPRFILIDPEGNIVKANAPRPSSPKLVELFKELNI